MINSSQIDSLKYFLENNYIYPIENSSLWKCIVIRHQEDKNKSKSEQKKEFKKTIVKRFKDEHNINIDKSGGVYVYKDISDTNIIYTGKGKSILKRLTDHYYESLLSNNKQLWPKYFAHFKDNLKLYILEINDYQGKVSKAINNNIDMYRHIIEQSIELVQPSIFKIFTDKFINIRPGVKTKAFKWEDKHKRILREIISVSK